MAENSTYMKKGTIHGSNLQGTNIPYVHSTTNNFSINMVHNQTLKTFRKNIDELNDWIKKIGKKKEKINKNIKQKGGPQLDFVDILNEVGHDNGDEGIKLITEFNYAVRQIQQAFKPNGTWEKKSEDNDKMVFYYKNTTGKPEYQAVKSAFENFAKLLAYFKRREGWFENDSAELQKYIPKDSDGTVIKKYDTARKMFEQVAVAVKKLNQLVGTDVEKLFTYKEDANGNIEFTSTTAFTNFIQEWQESAIDARWIGYEAEPMAGKLIEAVNNKIANKIEAEGIGVLTQNGKQTQPLGDIKVTAVDEIFYGSIKTNIASSTYRAQLNADGTYMKPKSPKMGNAVEVDTKQGYLLGTLYANSITAIPESKGGAADAALALDSYLNLLLSYAIEATSGRLKQEANDICFLIVNDRAMWYDDFLKIYWYDLIHEPSEGMPKYWVASYFLNKVDLFKSFNTYNNQLLYKRKDNFRKSLKKEWYRKRIITKTQDRIDNDDDWKDFNAENFIVQYANKYPIGWAKVSGLKHCLLAAPNKV